MLRGYRFLVLAIGGLTLAASQPQQPAENPEHRASEKLTQAAPSPTTQPALKPVDAVIYKPPCGDPKDHDHCDLEAQWKAANAARDAANWAKWQMALSAFGLAGLIYSLVLTRRAVKAATDASDDADKALCIAERNAAAAGDLARIAAETGEAQLRAWVLLETMNLDYRGDDVWDISLGMKNSGLSPAQGLLIKIGWQTSIIPGEQIEHEVTVWPETEAAGTLAPQGIARSEHIPITTQRLQTEWISIVCETIYTDSIVGKDRMTRFRIVARAITSGGQFAMRWTQIGKCVAT